MLRFADRIACRRRHMRNRGECRPGAGPVPLASRRRPAAGLPRPHYNFRTTITYAAPYTYRRRWRPLAVDETPVLYAPVVYVDVPYVVPVAPVLDPYVPYWERLPYACGVYGYC